MRIGILAVAGLAAAVAGCSQSEAEQRAEFKNQYTTRCKQRSGEMANPMLDLNKFCECNGVKISEALTKEDLKAMASDAEPAAGRIQSLSQTAGVQCLKEQGLQPGAAPAAAGSAPAPAPAADEAEPAAEEVEE